MLHRHTTLRWRLMASFSALILFCVLVSGFVGMRLYSRALSRQNQTDTLQLLSQAQRNLDTYVNSARTELSLLAGTPGVRAFLAVGDDTAETDRLAAEVAARAALTSYAGQMSQVYGLLLTGENGRYASNEFYRVTRDPLNREGWYQNAVRAYDPRDLVARPIQRNLRSWKNYSVDNVVMLTCPVRDEATGKLLGAVSADLKLSELEDSLTSLRTGQSGVIFVLDQSGEIVYAPKDPLIYRIRPQWFQSEQGSFTASLGGRDMTFLFSTSPNTGWKVIGMFSNDAPVQLVATMQKAAAVVFFLTLLIALLIALLLTSSVTRPISYLRSLMQQAEFGNLTVHYTPCGSLDVDRLGASFNAMIDRIRSLMDEVVEEQKRKRKAEMDALQAQINPHFLYNTLDTIHWMAKDYEAEDIEKLVSALTKLFRVSLSGGNEFITLSQEIAHVQSYLYIQKVRYEDKLNYRFEIDESLLGLTVLKLMIQPLAENALYHGLKPRPENGNILIRVYAENDTLCVDVSDDGVGVTAAQEQALNDSLSAREKSGGFGLFNVNERLVLYFGAPYGVRLERNPGGGVTSRLRHPILHKAPD